MSSDPVDVIPFEKDGVRGFLHPSPGRPERGLALTHGAGGNCDAPLLVAVAKAFNSAGFSVLRCDLPFRQKHKSGPPFPAMAAGDRAGLRAAVAALREIVPGRIYLGGHSYGGRQASILAAEDPELAAALLLLSYPLHPPKKPDQLRTEHFPKLRTSIVFVHGATDPFGSIAELEAAVAMINAPTRILPIERASHDLARGRFDLKPMVEALLAQEGVV